MAIYTKSQLFSKIDTYIYTNNTRQITALKLNELLKDMLDSVEDWMPENHEVSFTSQSTITVTHNLGYKPLVQILDSTGHIVQGQVDHNEVTMNSFVVTLSSAITGVIIYH